VPSPDKELIAPEEYRLIRLPGIKERSPADGANLFVRDIMEISEMPPMGAHKNKSYQVTIWLTVTDPLALKNASTELAKAIEMPGWNTRRGIRDHLLMLIEPGEIPGVKILETVVNQTDSLP
jgi:hypothetical protein